MMVPQSITEMLTICSIADNHNIQGKDDIIPVASVVLTTLKLVDSRPNPRYQRDHSVGQGPQKIRRGKSPGLSCLLNQVLAQHVFGLEDDLPT